VSDKFSEWRYTVYIHNLNSRWSRAVSCTPLSLYFPGTESHLPTV
jgi:hypothetical protein